MKSWEVHAECPSIDLTTRSNAMQGQQRNLISLLPISCKQHSIHHSVPTTTSLLLNYRGIHGNGSQNETHRTTTQHLHVGIPIRDTYLAPNNECIQHLS